MKNSSIDSGGYKKKGPNLTEVPGRPETSRARSNASRRPLPSLRLPGAPQCKAAWLLTRRPERNDVARYCWPALERLLQRVQSKNVPPFT